MLKYNLLHVPVLSVYIQESSTVYINKYPTIHCHTSLKSYVFIMCTYDNNKVRELYFQGTVHYQFVPTGQTVSQAYYLEVLKRLRKKVRRKRPELLANNS